MCGYLFQRLSETTSYSLKEHEAFFLNRQNLIFLIVSGSIRYCFSFRLNIFTSKILNLLLLSRAERAGSRNFALKKMASF